MKKRPKVIIIKLNRRLLFAALIILILILSWVLLKKYQVLKIFSHKRTKQTLVIDPGHGGIDGGTGDRKDILEKDINLDMGIKLKKELLVEGFNVIMTREKDESLEDLSHINVSRYRRDLDARRGIIDENKPAAFISLHVNSSKSPSARGVKIYHYPEAEKGMDLAQAIADSVDIHLYEEFLKDTGLVTEILAEDFYILRETDYTGVLVEVGFITNPQENALLKDDSYKERLAYAIKKGILTYLK